MSDYKPPIPSDPQVRLIKPTSKLRPRSWEGEASHLVTQGTGLWRVTGAAGSGVSSVVVDTVIERIRQGWEPSSMLVIATSKESASRLRQEISEYVSKMDYVSEGPLVRSVHSLAFALIRDASDEDIRLITGAEQDAVIRELLRGQAEDGHGGWPPEQREGLRMVGFARQLRDFLLRAVERGVGPDELVALGEQYEHANWTAAGNFLREYKQVMSLAGSHSFSASELVTEALRGPEPAVKYRGVFIDDAQHLDPKSAELISRFFPEAELAVVAGDAEQSVFRFRGANPDFLNKLNADHELVLESKREASTSVVVAETESAHADLIADTVRRAHLIDGRSWSEIAVVVRSAGMIAPIRRTLLAAGVPVHINPTDVVLSEQRIVAAMILGLRALTELLNPIELEDLLLGPIGGADPVTLRRLLRGLRQAEMKMGGQRRAIVVLGDLLEETDAEMLGFLTERELNLLDRVRSVLDSGRQALADKGSIEEVLWALWSATDLSNSLSAISLRGGASGSQADRDLDAMMALFDAAGDYVERRPSAGVRSFILHISEQELPTGMRERRGAIPEAVEVLTAHGTTGREWKRVIVAGVQEGSWPSLGETGTLLGQEEFVDLVDEGIDPDIIISRSVERLAEERRLFYLATTRATETLLVTAVNSPDSDEVREPSRFLDSLRQPIVVFEGEETNQIAEPEELGNRLLSIPAMVAELRRVVNDPRDPRRKQAARQLSRLAEAEIPGADPSQWMSLREPSTEEVLVEGRIFLSPSRIEKLLNCPLRAVLDRLDSEEETPIAMLKGTLVHAYAEAVAGGVDPSIAEEKVTSAYMQLANVPGWSHESAEIAFRRILTRTHTWLQNSRADFTEVGTEMDVSVTIDDTVSIRGRMDRLERNRSEELVVVDFKTGKTQIAVKDMADHPQLSAYQLALSRGVLRNGKISDPDVGETPDPVGGGLLVYPAIDAKAVGQRMQDPKTQEDLDEFAAMLPGLAEHLRGPNLLARVNPTCSNCPVRSLCPVQPEGRVIHA
ncbi:ATP-dependent helicase [Corynebacterium crudilactis]|uniref:DNA 3'-5' helicase n=1 Tax=Corynebacterium crudilactis TaxID=1652495 RepID=A0A172QRV5_9CORY|nr:ATP-dependent helicase [Corynebacterium crudilactis]ANE03425.1 ATP-dependent DNA helicase [Corynebacterium crudilactis]